MLTIRQAADALNVSASLVRRLISSKKLPAVSISANPNSKKPAVRIDPADVYRYAKGK